LQVNETALLLIDVWERHWYSPNLISHKVFVKSFCKSQFPHKFVNFFILVIMKDKVTDLCGNKLLQNDFETLCVK